MIVCLTSCYPFTVRRVTVYNPTNLPVQINSTDFGCYNVMLGANQSRTFESLSSFTTYAYFDVEGAYFIKTSQGTYLNPFSNSTLTLEPNCCFVIIENHTGETLENVRCGIYNAEYDPQKAVTNPLYTVGRKNDISRYSKKGAKIWPGYDFKLNYKIDDKSYMSSKKYTSTEAGTTVTISVKTYY